MKNIFITLLLITLFTACGDVSDEMITPTKPALVTHQASGTLSCVDNEGISEVELSFLAANGTEYSVTTDSDGNFSIQNLPEDTYTISFNNSRLYQYSSQEYDMILEDLRNVILGIRQKTNIDHLAYNLINYDDGLTTYDSVLFARLNQNEDKLEDVVFPWRYLLTSNLNSENEITDVLTLDYLEGMDIQITGIYIGDINGVACSN